MTTLFCTRQPTPLNTCYQSPCGQRISILQSLPACTASSLGQSQLARSISGQQGMQHLLDDCVVSDAGDTVVEVAQLHSLLVVKGAIVASCTHCMQHSAAWHLLQTFHLLYFGAAQMLLRDLCLATSQLASHWTYSQCRHGDSHLERSDSRHHTQIARHLRPVTAWSWW